MLKVDSKFKLDRSYCGPYRVHGVTAIPSYYRSRHRSLISTKAYLPL